MSRRIPIILLLLLFAATLAGCGSKGALVMPDQQATSKKKHAQKPAPASVTPAQPSTPSGDDSGKPW